MSSVTFSTSVGGDGSTVTDDNNATTGLKEGGWKTRFVPALTQEVAVANYVVNAALTVLGGATTNSTSLTSLAIATGSKSLTLSESGKAYIIGQYVIIASTATPANNMIGQVTSFSGTSLVVNVTTINGSGTLASWSVSVTGSPSVAIAGGSQTFTSSGTFTIPSGVVSVKITVVGGGGGGGNANGSTNGATGGTSSVDSGTQTITSISATGGGGTTSAGADPKIGGVGSGGQLNVAGSSGGAPGVNISGIGGGTILGGSTKNAPAGSAGLSGSNYGSGGSGSVAFGTSGAGGGGGGAAINYFAGLTAGNTLLVTIGAGGAGGTGTYPGGAAAAGVVFIEY